MLHLQCGKHPRYGAKLPPKASCEPCIAIWKIRNLAEQNRVAIVENRTERNSGSPSEG